MPRTIAGVVRGGRIELIDAMELDEGQRVQVMIEQQAVSTPPASAVPLLEEGVVHTSLEDPGLIAMLDKIRHNRRPLTPSPAAQEGKSAAGMLERDRTWDEHLCEVLQSRRSGVYLPRSQG